MISFIVFFSISANAQVFIGGGFNFDTQGGKYRDESKRPGKATFSLSPQIGKFLSDKVAAGVGLNLGFSSENNQASIETVTRSTYIGIAPFLRYYAFTTEKFSVFGQATAGMSFGNEKTKYDGDVIDEEKYNVSFFNIAPGLAYNLSDKISLETRLNFLNFGFSRTARGDGDNKDIYTNFGFGANLDNIVKVGDITIGAIFKF